MSIRHLAGHPRDSGGLMSSDAIRRALYRGNPIPSVFGPDRPLMGSRLRAVVEGLELDKDELLHTALVESDSGPLNRRRLAHRYGRSVLKNQYYDWGYPEGV